MSTRNFDQRTPVDKDRNLPTVSQIRPDRRGPRPDTAFTTHYTDLLIALHRVQDPGLVVLTANRAGVVSVATVAATSKVRSLTVGRHERADVYLAEPDIALRHLQILVWSDESGQVRYRVLDLRTYLGLRGEDEATVHGAEADGPAFFYVGGYTLVCVPRQGPVRWPSDPVDGLRALPRRTVHPVPDAGRMDGPMTPSGRTLVQLLPPLSDGTTADLRQPIGTMYLRSSRARREIVLDRAALWSGILLGRYGRCDSGGGGGPFGHHGFLSRIHAVVFEAGGAMYLADCGSSNGVWRGSVREDQPFPFDPGDEVGLGIPGELSVRVHWEVGSGGPRLT